MPASRSWDYTRHGGECVQSEGQVEQRDAWLYEALGVYRNPLYKDSTDRLGLVGWGCGKLWRVSSRLAEPASRVSMLSMLSMRRIYRRRHALTQAAPRADT